MFVVDLSLCYNPVCADLTPRGFIKTFSNISLRADLLATHAPVTPPYSLRHFAIDDMISSSPNDPMKDADHARSRIVPTLVVSSNASYEFV